MAEQHNTNFALESNMFESIILQGDWFAEGQFWNVTATGYKTSDGPDEPESVEVDARSMDVDDTEDDVIEELKNIADMMLAQNQAERVVVMVSGREIETYLHGQQSSQMKKERAIEIFDQCIAQSGCGPWSDQLDKVMTPDEYAYVKRIWIDPARPGTSTFAGTLLDIKNGFLDAVNWVPSAKVVD